MGKINLDPWDIALEQQSHNNSEEKAKKEAHEQIRIEQENKKHINYDALYLELNK